jgi:predicted acyltransferase
LGESTHLTEHRSRPILAEPARAQGLDALRGLAILAMLLSGQLPFGEHSLPAWMYHAQVPPPDHVFNGNLPGITWVDLVFPFFLFSLGAAIPLALTRRIERGEPKWKIGGFILGRGMLLAFFALYVQAIRPGTISEHPTVATQLVALLAFALLFPIFTRLPRGWPRYLCWGLRLVGWAGTITLLALLRYPGDTGFSLTRSDIIIVVLANMAVFGSLCWWATRNNLLLRLGVLGLLLAIRLSNMPTATPGWVHDLWMWSPAPWIYQLYYCQYLFIVIPGTIVGDTLVGWMKRDTATEKPNWSRTRFAGIAALMVVFVLVQLVGLYARWLLPTTLVTFALCGFGAWLMRNSGDGTERFFQRLFHWAIYWLVLGMFLEPYEGGIKKDRATMSYYFVTVGLAICVLIAFIILLDVLRRRRWAKLLIDNGQNPMIAYAAINNLILPLFALTSVEALLSSVATSPWMGFVKGLIITLAVGIFVSFCTQRKIFWRS